MKIDYSKYPEIPPNCQMNLNRKTGASQVFREGKNVSPWCKSHRECIGSISAKGVFTLSPTYSLQKKLYEMQELQGAAQTSKVDSKVQDVVNKSETDTRKDHFVSVPMVAIVLSATLMALTGESDCVSISDYLTRHQDFFKRYTPDCDIDKVSSDTIRRSMMLIDPEKFETFYLKLLDPIIRSTLKRIITLDTQAVRATRKTTTKDKELHGASLIMNVYDVGNRVCIAQKLIEDKKHDISVGPQLLEGLDLFGTIVTADAMSCQANFVNTVTRKADYCISLGRNQETSWREAIYLFNSTNPIQIVEYVGKAELGHGRIEQRTVSMISGRLLSKQLREKWTGLSGGAMVRVRKRVSKKNSKEDSVEDRYYITSIPAAPDTVGKIGAVIRAHWDIENNLHWTLDNLFRQDRIQADNPNYIANRSSLNKLALALLENYRFYLWDQGETKHLSLHLLQERCRNPKSAIECIGYALGQYALGQLN